MQLLEIEILSYHIFYIQLFLLSMPFLFQVTNKLKWAIGLLLWIYIIYRAFCLEITHDEAFSYSLVKMNNWKGMVGTANTHWLNTLFTRIFLWLPGEDSPWKLRMLSILCWPLYCFCTIRLSLEFRNNWIGNAFFILLVSNPFLLIYFSLGRGYAASCTFILLVLWLLSKFLKSGNPTSRQWTLVFISASGAILANFTSFYFFMGSVVAYLLMQYLTGNIKTLLKKEKLQINLLITGVSLFTIVSLLFIKYVTGDLDYGSGNDLAGSVLGSLIANDINMDKGANFLHAVKNDYDSAYHYFGILVLLLLSAALIISIYSSVTTKRATAWSVSVYISFVILLSCFFFKLTFKVNYLLDRTTLMLFPVIALGILGSVDYAIFLKRSLKNFVVVCMVIIMVGCTYNFYMSVSKNYLKEFYVQNDTKKCLDYLKKQNAKHIGLHYWHFSVYSNYYALAFPGKYEFSYERLTIDEMLNPVDSAKFSRFDYLLLGPPYNENSSIFKNWHLVKSYSLSDARILKHN
jgi:hypothetical protein